ncbi:exodeoxyribonuclease V subunit beta [Anaeromyxobacter sp. Fw109-5]|uniref:UvrD-helicase domain-containing protein n=1 Tax=Anaeromyxobacter sp. (strain Fw109-5) TaxID=404589 RepID=UPI0000ED6E12|nr:UvrD-helicase domain-containing protein [Anaeromyxobacter sp. Fw109-5]ABS28189.1 UvrD/REP helicase [Anaeromyxobacter sp. Fw109-5]
MKIDVISASAGTGKTHRLTGDLTKALLDGSARPEGVVAITYTVKAAGELESRIRESLLKAGRPELAARIRDGYIGTIHSVCQRLLREFALEAGLSPWLEPIPEPERKRLFDVALASVLAGREGPLNELARRLEIEDWKEILLEIVDAGRANGMDRAALERSAAASRAGLEKLLGKPTLDNVTYLEKLDRTLRPLLAKLEEQARETGQAASKKRAAAARRLVADLNRGLVPSWKSQFQLAQEVDMKKLRTWSAEYVDLANEHHASAGFHDDVLGMQAQLFALAGEALGTFVAEKTAAGVVDFGDMLARAREVLERPAVREALRDRLDLVLVDEFQDTSPLQLAVVSALAGLARRSIWVGDRKQAIFAFQGTDPELMTAATEAALGGRTPDILASSWRSRPDLVAMTSELFARALAPHGFPDDQVRIVAAKPDHPRLRDQGAFECWRWMPEKVERNGKDVKASEPDALGAGVAELLSNPPLVRERGNAEVEAVRPASFRDVAILARSNARCQQIAAALRARGIPAKVSLGGVTLTPEGVLARAALALLADPRDGVAALQVAWLGGAASSDPDGWLSRRLLEIASWRATAKAAEGKGEHRPPAPLAFEDDGRVAGLRKAVAAAERLSPAQALDLALRTAGVAELVRSWPEPAQRVANLEALRAEAAAYEQLCEAQRSAATMLGLVAHLASLDAGDDAGKQAAPSSEDAVTVLTWHKAKGLEWPVVVLSHLDFSRERGVFEVAVEPAPRFDFARPLEGRWVRYWPWPYGGMSKELALLDRALETAEARRATEADRRERLRLLYVGFTRPRDLLVLVARCTEKSGPATASLDLLVGAKGEPLLAAPFEDQAGAAIGVGQQEWRCRVRTPSGLPPATPAPARSAVQWYASAPRAERPRERLNPSAEPLAGTPRVVQVERLGGRHALAASPEQAGPTGDAIHAFLAADQGGTQEARLTMATRILKAFRVVGAVAPDTLLAASDALRTWLDARYPGATWYREWPVRARLGGPTPRLVVGDVDLFLELPDGFVLVDHKSFPGSERERDRRLVEEYAPQLGWYARVLADALKKPMKAAFVHLPIRGEMAQVAL